MNNYITARYLSGLLNAVDSQNPKRANTFVRSLWPDSPHGSLPIAFGNIEEPVEISLYRN